MGEPQKEKKAYNSHVSNDGNAFTVIEEYLDGSTPRGKKMLMTRAGAKTVEFELNDWLMWKAVSITGDLEAIKNEIKKDGTNINWQVKGHPHYQGKTYLITAVLQGRLDLVELLLQHGADPNLADDNDLTPANYAIEYNHEDIFKVLVKNEKINVNQVIEGADPLLHACMLQNNKEWGKILVERGADINLHTNDTPSPLCFALDGGNDECALWLIELGADVSIAFDGIPPMCFASKRGMVNVMEALLEKGATISRGEYATSPLHVAGINRKVDSVKFLLAHGADVNEQQDSGETPIMVSAQSPEIVELLLAKNAKIDPKDAKIYLFSAAEIGSIKLLKLFLETYEMDPLVKNEQNQTLLFAGAPSYAKDSTNMSEHIELLLQFGIDVNATDTDGVTALLFAVENRMNLNVKALLKAGANPNAQDNDGMTPLHMACGHHMQEMIQILVAAGGDMHLKSNSGETPMDLEDGDEDDGPRVLDVISLNPS